MNGSASWNTNICSDCGLVGYPCFKKTWSSQHQGSDDTGRCLPDCHSDLERRQSLVKVNRNCGKNCLFQGHCGQERGEWSIDWYQLFLMEQKTFLTPGSVFQNNVHNTMDLVQNNSLAYKTLCCSHWEKEAQRNIKNKMAETGIYDKVPCACQEQR